LIISVVLDIQREFAWNEPFDDLRGACEDVVSENIVLGGHLLQTSFRKLSTLDNGSPDGKPCLISSMWTISKWWTRSTMNVKSSTLKAGPKRLLDKKMDAIFASIFLSELSLTLPYG
jgi:hypothetical protein